MTCECREARNQSLLRRQNHSTSLSVQADSDRRHRRTPFWSHFRVNEMLIQLWEFADAPEHLQSVVPVSCAGGWLAYIGPGGGHDVVELLIDRWNSSGFSLARFELVDGSIVL